MLNTIAGIGAAAGREWAKSAEPEQLERLSESWPVTETTETDDAHGPPGIFLAMILPDDEYADRSAINEFWTDNCEDWEGNLELDEVDDEDSDCVRDNESRMKYSSEFWDAFVAAALAVHESGTVEA